MTKISSPLLVLIVLFASTSSYAADDGSANDIAELKAEIARLSHKIEVLESRQNIAGAAPPQQAQPSPSSLSAATAPETARKNPPPGSFIIPGTETSVKFGGYIKLDAIGNDKGYGSPVARFYNIPLGNSPSSQQSWQTTFTAQQTRLNLATQTPTASGDLNIFVEGDFYGGNATNGNTGGYGPQLRHAYGSLGPFLAGQTWSNFEDVDAASESLDYIGSAGRIFVRQAQIRYTHSFDAVTISSSAEAAIGNDTAFTTQNGVSGVGGASVSTHSSMPDFTLRGDYKYADNAYVSLRGLFSQINADRSAGTNNYTATAYGYAVGISGKQGLFDKDSINYDFNYGIGTGRYVYDIGAGSNYYNTTTGNMETQKFYAATAGFRHFWSPQFHSNLFGGFVRNVNDIAYADTTANRIIASGHANLIWQPVDLYKMGIEYMRGYREIESGASGNLDRMQASFMYNFQ